MKLHTRLPGLPFWLLALLFFLCVLSLFVGAIPLGPADLWHVLANLGSNRADTDTFMVSQVLLNLRLPRIVAAIVSGFSLALAGTLMQGLFRNPLAGPDILGVSAGASLGAVTVICSGAAAVSAFAVPIASVIGAFLTGAVVWLIAGGRRRTPLLSVVLAGLAVAGLVNGIISLILLFARPYEVTQFIFWTMGGLDGRGWEQVLPVIPVVLIASFAAFFAARRLDVLALGEEQAHSAGLGVETSKRLILGVAALLTGMAISVSGPIGFIGLLVPHTCRYLGGPSHRTLLPTSALAGACVLLAADLVGRVVASPHEINAGIITSLVGSPFFLLLVVRRRGISP